MSAPVLTLGLLLGNLERELRDLAKRCRALQSAAARGDGTSPTPRQEMMVALQDLDPLTQILEDLAGLAAEAADGPLSRLRVDPQAAGAPLRLESLRRRLLATASCRPEAQAEGFLL